MTETRNMDCSEALALLAELMDAELDHVDRIAVEAHLRTCRSCYSRAEFERALKTRLASIARQEVDPVFEDRIRALVGRFAAARHAHSTD